MAALPLWETVQRNILQEAGGNEIRAAVDRGLVTVGDLGFDIDTLIRLHLRGWQEGEVLQHAQLWASELFARMGDHRTHLLFDREAGALAEMLAGQLSVLGLNQGRRAAVGAGLIARLPTIPMASLDEIIDVRDDLNPLVEGYRQAVTRFAQQMPALPIGEQNAAAHDLWDTQVRPALAVLDEEIRNCRATRVKPPRGGRRNRSVIPTLAAPWTPRRPSRDTG